MSAVEDLTEVAQRAATAEATARSSKWLDRDALQRTITDLSRSLEEAVELLGGGPLGSRRASPVWENRARVLLTDAPQLTDTSAIPESLNTDASARWSVTDAETAAPDPDTRAAVTAEADAAAAVNVARIALIRAHVAVLVARLAAIDAGDTTRTDASVRGYQPVTGTNPLAAHGFAVARDVRAELRHIFRDRPRDIGLRISMSLGWGLAYLAILRFVFWRQTVEHEFPYLALYAFSGIAGSAVCTNALCIDAARVRTKLLSGERLWHIMVAKNLALGVLLGLLGLVANVLLLFWTRDWVIFIKANGMFVTMLLLWFGVGNVLAVVSPMKDMPLVRRPRDGTLVPYLISFGVSYAISYLVNLMLYWRIWAKETLLERFSGPWVPVLLIVASSAATYVLLTVLAVSLAQQPGRRRQLTREMVDYRAEKSATQQVP